MNRDCYLFVLDTELAVYFNRIAVNMSITFIDLCD